MNGCLADDHADLAELLSELHTTLDAGDTKLSYARLDRFWARLGVHIRAEHLRLFPAILRALSANPNCQTLGSPSLSQAEGVIEELRRDHDFFMHELARAIATMRDLIANNGQDVGPILKDVRARIGAVEERLAIHNEIEESQVYLWIGTLLTDEEQSGLATLLQNELGKLPHRFSAN
jgi:iron-sulfur cluster repair protein YtfE (RIC family)